MNYEEMQSQNQVIFMSSVQNISNVTKPTYNTYTGGWQGGHHFTFCLLTKCTSMAISKTCASAYDHCFTVYLCDQNLHVKVIKDFKNCPFNKKNKKR